MNQALQWIAIVLAGGAIAKYAQYRDRLEHDKKEEEKRHADERQIPLYGEHRAPESKILVNSR
jgi:hypothetical protein